jgi:hypothetical protein
VLVRIDRLILGRNLPRRMSLLLALFGHAKRVAQCPLSGEERKTSARSEHFRRLTHRRPRVQRLHNLTSVNNIVLSYECRASSIELLSQFKTI